MGEKYFSKLFYPVKFLSRWNFYKHRFYTWLPSSISSSSWSSKSCFTWYSKPFSICSLAWCRYCRTSMLHLRFCPILLEPYCQSYRLPPSQRPMLLWTVQIDATNWLAQFTVSNKWEWEMTMEYILWYSSDAWDMKVMVQQYRTGKHAWFCIMQDKCHPLTCKNML